MTRTTHHPRRKARRMSALKRRNQQLLSYKGGDFEALEPMYGQGPEVWTEERKAGIIARAEQEVANLKKKLGQ